MRHALFDALAMAGVSMAIALCFWTTLGNTWAELCQVAAMAGFASLIVTGILMALGAWE